VPDWCGACPRSFATFGRCGPEALRRLAGWVLRVNRVAVTVY
jgi:hypothetical protein